MKKAVPVLIGVAVLGLLIVLVLSGSNAKKRRFDERITLKSAEKIPYGTSAARTLLPELFPDARIYTDNKAPGLWDSVDVTESGQALILIADHLDAEESEMEELGRFVDRGNYVFLIGRTASYDVTSFFDVGYYRSDDYFTGSDTVQLRIALSQPAYSSPSYFTYPGRKYASTFDDLDTNTTAVLGRDISDNPNFIQFNRGSGSFFLHSAPLAFSNYFVLHKANSAYFEGVLSVLPKRVDKLVWSEYYLNKPSQNNDSNEPSWLGALFKQPAFRWAFLLAAGTLVLALLLGMRRRQRLIPPHERPKNDSLDFVQTLGRLYHDKSDHHNLAMKMAAYFLEHVRSRYKLPTHTLDEEFISRLQQRSGYPVEQTVAIVEAIQQIRETSVVTDTQLTAFYKQLEHFYQNT